MSIVEPCEAVSIVKSDAISTRNGRDSPSRNKPARLATRTKWSLSYLVTQNNGAREQMAVILRWTAQERMDARLRANVARLDRLCELDHAVAQLALHNAAMERAIHDARAGVYNGPMVIDG